MDMQGVVFEKQEQEIATVEVADGTNYKRVKVIVNGAEVMVFPLPLDADTNEVNTRTASIINQTCLVNNPVRVDVTEIE